MKLDVSEVAQKVRDQSGNSTLGDSVVRLVRQQRASAAIEAYMQAKAPNVEALSDTLEYEMADMLQQYFDDGGLDQHAPVADNRSTLKLIARHAAMKFANLKRLAE